MEINYLMNPKSTFDHSNSEINLWCTCRGLNPEPSDPYPQKKSEHMHGKVLTFNL